VSEISDAPLGQFMQRLATRYARYFQKSIATTGHCFERRYHAGLIASDAQLLAAVRYAHLNPVRAGLVSDAAAYRWSGHRGYLGRGQPAWLCTDMVLDLLAPTRVQARSAYAGFVDGPTPEWEQSGYPGCAGGDLSAKATPGAPLSESTSAPETLDQLIGRICAQEGVTEFELRNRSRARRLTDVRVRIALECRSARLGSMSDLARRFDRHVASLCKAVARRSEPK
jgi:hypothetical protein